MLSFELGLLWPRFMQWAGPIIGMPFSLEGFAFFLEAIFLGVYLYGWDRVSPRAHLFAGIVVAASGALSGIFVVTVNAWMNTPAGFEIVDGQVTNIDLLAAMLNPAAGAQVVHMLLAAYMAVGFGVAGIHARWLLIDPKHPFHRAALSVALIVGIVPALLQPIAGDWAGKVVARSQAAKFAAMEGHFNTEAWAPLRIGGWPDEDRRETRYAIEIPGGLGFLAKGDPSAVVTGLNDIPRQNWPPVRWVHLSFQAMVGAGTALAALGALDGLAGLAAPALRVARGAEGAPRRRAAGVRRDRGRLDGDRTRPPALDRAGRHAHGGCGDADAGPGRLADRNRRHLPAADGRRGRADAAHGDRDAAEGAADMDPALLLGGVVVVALTAYALMGGADYGGGVWDLAASGPTAADQRHGDRARDRADLGSQPRAG